MRWIRVLVLSLLVAAGIAGATGNQPINTSPINSSNQVTSNYLPTTRTFLLNEDAARQADWAQPFVISGGLHGTSGSKTSSAIALEAYTSSGNRICADDNANDCSQTVAVDYDAIGCADTDTAWVIGSASSSDNLDNFVRVTGTNYFVDCTSTNAPVLPTDSIWLMKVTISGAAITAVSDLRQFLPFTLGNGNAQFVYSGCLPSVPSSSLTIDPFACIAFLKDTSRVANLQPTIQEAAGFAVPDSATVCLGLYNGTSAPGSWTAVANTQYLYQAAACSAIAAVDGLIEFAEVTVTTHVITGISYTGNRDPDKTVFRYCGNYPSLQACYDAIPSTGGVMILPEGTTSFSGLTIQKPIIMRGGGAAMVNDTWTTGSPTHLSYTGSGIAITVTNDSRGSILEDFQLVNAGTGTVGIELNCDECELRRVYVYEDALSGYDGFSTAGIRIGTNVGQEVNGITLDRVYVRQQPADGIQLIDVSEATISNSRLIQNQGDQIQVGDATHNVNNLRIINGTSIAVADVSGSRGINVIRSLYVMTVRDAYFECDNDTGANYCIDSSGAIVFNNLNLEGGYFKGDSFGHTAPYAININRVNANLHANEVHFLNFSTAAIKNTSSNSILVSNSQCESCTDFVDAYGPTVYTFNNDEGTQQEDRLGKTHLLVYGGLKVGESGVLITQRLSGTDTWNPGSLADGDTTWHDVTVTGTVAGDECVGSFPMLEGGVRKLGMAITCLGTANATATVVITNHTGGVVDLDSGTVRATVTKY